MTSSSAPRAIFPFPSQFRQCLLCGSPHFCPAMPTSPTGTYLPIRVVAPVGSPCQATARASASRRAALKTKCHALLLRGRLAMVDRSWEETTGSEQRRRSTPVGPTACAGPPRSGTLFTSSYLAPGSKHLDETQVESMEHHPDIHDSQKRPSLSLASGTQRMSCLPIPQASQALPALPQCPV